MEAMPSESRNLPAREHLPEEFRRGCDVSPCPADPTLPASVSAGLRVERYGSRFWAVWDGPTLVCVTVYRKGARSVIELVEALTSQVRRASN
jgi:hypothetical protein